MGCYLPQIRRLDDLDLPGLLLLMSRVYRGKTVVAGPRSAVNAEAVESLTRRLVAGCDEAFREFHGLYFDRLYEFLLVVTRGQEHQAQEALQETLLRILRYIRVFESDDVFWSWQKALARSAARDANRKLTRYSNLLRRFAIRRLEKGKSSDQGEDTRLNLVLKECLDELKPCDRLLLLEKYQGAATVKVLASEMELTEKAVEARLLRLRRLMRKRMLEKLGSL